MIPTAAELDAWVETLRGGYATKEMLPRVIEGYKRLLIVAEMAAPVPPNVVHPIHHSCCMAIEEIHDLLEPLVAALNALKAPMPEEVTNRAVAPASSFIAQEAMTEEEEDDEDDARMEASWSQIAEYLERAKLKP